MRTNFFLYNYYYKPVSLSKVHVQKVCTFTEGYRIARTVLYILLMRLDILVFKMEIIIGIITRTIICKQTGIRKEI